MVKESIREELVTEVEVMRRRIEELEALNEQYCRAAVLLEQSEALYRLLAEYSSDWIWTMDMNLRFTYVSPAVTGLLGYSIEETMALTMQELMPPQYIEMAGKVLAEELSIEQAPDMSKYRALELELFRNDGSLVWVEVRVKFIRDENGRRIGILGISRDITGRKLAEERIGHLTLVLRAIRNVNQIITKEKDRDRLLRGICDSLIETRGYHSAWIIVFARNGGIKATMEAGLGRGFPPFIQQLERGELPHCGCRVLDDRDIIVTREPLRQCRDCPLASQYGGRGIMTAPLEYGDRIYGLISVSMPQNITGGEEERSLLKEVSADIAFALQNMELEEERRRVEEALRESEELSRGLLGAATVGIYIVQEGRFQYINPRFEQITGYTKDELLGHCSLDSVYPDDREMVRTRAIQCLKGSSDLPYEYRYIRKDGKTLWILEKVTSIMHRGQMAAVGSFMDITDWKQAEEQFKQSEFKYRTALESARDGIIIIDPDGCVVDMNQTCIHALGFSAKEEVVGKMAMELLTPETQQEMARGLWEDVRRTLREGKGYITNLELVGRTRDGRETPVEVNISRLAAEDGQERGAVIVIRDITERKRVEKQILDHTRRLEALHAISVAVSQTMDLEEMLGSALDKVLEVIGVEAGYIHQFHADKRQLILTAHRGLSPQYIDAIERLDVREEALQRWNNYPQPAFRLGQVVSEETEEALSAAGKVENVRVLVAIPLWSKCEMQGGLTLVGDMPRRFTPEELDLLKAIGNDIAVGIENAKLLGQTMRLSITDELTGLYNRRHFYEVLDNEMSRTSRYGRPFSLVMLDLDGFKDYNDRFGHQSGDAVLRSLSHTLQEALRKSDTAFRYGGDEFTILLPATDAGKARRIVDRLRSKWLRTPKIEHAALQNPLGFSAGVAQFPDDAETADGLIFLADTALYHAKRAGGYCSTLVSELPSLAPGIRDRETLEQVYALAATVDARDPFTYGHSERVCAIAEIIGRALALLPEEFASLQYAALLHDIGKVGVPDSILTKSGNLTDAEWRAMRKHPAEGAKIIGHIKELAGVVPVIRHHHEWYDGAGYPDGLKGEEIPLGARIISIADAYDTMTTMRPYRMPVSPRIAFEELLRYAGSQFDPGLVQVFCQAMVNQAVVLSDREPSSILTVGE